MGMRIASLRESIIAVCGTWHGQGGHEDFSVGAFIMGVGKTGI